MQYRDYERMTELKILEEPLTDYANVSPPPPTKQCCICKRVRGLVGVV
jgi:hypothetical protein